MQTAQLAKLLPQTAKQMERLANLKLAIKPIKARAELFAIPLVFFVTKQQQEIVGKALSTFENQISSDKTTKAQRRAAAITVIAEHYLASTKAVRNGVSPQNLHLQNKATLV
jgi:hypothetical protein